MGLALRNEEVIGVPWSPQRGPQLDAIMARNIPEMLYGGAAFGGKTDFLLGDFLQDVETYGSAWRGILFRKTMGELDDIIARSHEIFPQTGAFYNDSKAIWRWPNGAYLRLRYLEQDRHKYRYQGHAYTWIGWDELTHWATDSAYRYLRGRLRSAVADIPVKRIRATANPGNVGHQWVKARFISHAPGGYMILRDAQTNERHVFIPSRIIDNQIGLKRDPGYPDRLKGLGSAALVKAMLNGDWDVIEGAFFDCWSSNMHVIRPFKIPKEWIRIRAGDWGSYSPFCIGWYAVVQEDFKHPRTGQIIPRGALIKYREWYGTADPAVPNLRGLKLSAEKVAKGIAMLEDSDEKISLAVMDPSTFKADGGPSIGERLNAELIKLKRHSFGAADNTRVSTRDGADRKGPMSGWDQMRQRMVGKAEQDMHGVVDWSTGRPMLYFFDVCVASIRTIPNMQHDPVRPEDLDCWVAGTMVSTTKGSITIEDVVVGDMVDTPIGPRAVTQSYLSGTGETYWAELSNGERLEGTGRHRIYVRGHGLVALRDLSCHMILDQRISSCGQNALYIAASLTHVMRDVFTTIRTAQSWVAAARHSIDKYGLMPVGKFLMAGMSTTSTTITTTINTKTSYAYRRTSMAGFIWQSVLAKAAILPSLYRDGEQAGLERPPFAITSKRCATEHRSDSLRAEIVEWLLRRDILGNYTARQLAPVRRAANRLIKLAKYAGLNFGRSVTKQKKCAPVHIVAVGCSGAATKVYNLTVHEANLFYANGILSSNTKMEDHAADETRYACSSRPWLAPVQPDPEKTDAYQGAADQMEEAGVSGTDIKTL